uniref:Uncharacterized protein n=1 Tax=Magallana gigas TaxID=29159 RepID=K1R199_MAGGI
MGKIHPAHELAWFLCVMGSSGNQASTRLSESGSGFRAIFTHKIKGAVIAKLSSLASSMCPESIHTVSIVSRCPSNAMEWKSAAERKKCDFLGKIQNCTQAENFVYHCVLNKETTELLELCAPVWFMAEQTEDQNEAVETLLLKGLNDNGVKTIGDLRDLLSAKIKKPKEILLIVNKEEGIIFNDETEIKTSKVISSELMIGNQDRMTKTVDDKTVVDDVISNRCLTRGKCQMSCGDWTAPNTLFDWTKEKLPGALTKGLPCPKCGYCARYSEEHKRIINDPDKFDGTDDEKCSPETLELLKDPDTLFYWIGNKLLKEGSTDLSCPKCSWTWDPDEFVEDCKMSFDERIFFQEVLNVNMLKKAFAQVEDHKKAKI